MRIDGYYLDGTTSRRSPARLEFGQNSKGSIRLNIDCDETLHKQSMLTFAELKIESRLGKTPREIAFGEDQLFITDDNDAVDQLVSQYTSSNSSGLLHKLESRMTLVLLSTLLTIGFVWSFIVYGIPSTAKFVANKLPVIATDQFGSNLAILDQAIFEPSELTQERQNEILTLVEPYIEQHRELNPSLNFRSGMSANALALPNGEIVFTDDFVNLAENDQELLAVFFHELGHLEHKHLTRRVLQDSLMTLVVVFITGDMVDLLTGLPILVLELSYSREFEVEADTFALEKMHQEAIPLENFATIMESLQNYYKPIKTGMEIPKFLSTHPATKERIALTEKLIAKYRNQSVN